MKNPLCLIVVSAIILSSCTKEEAENLDTLDPTDKTPPIITVVKPANNQVYISGDSIIVEGKVVDEKVLYKGSVTLRNDATSMTTAEQFYGTHFLSTINFRLAYKAVVTTATDFSVIVKFDDHGGNSATSTTKIKVNP